MICLLISLEVCMMVPPQLVCHECLLDVDLVLGVPSPELDSL